MQNFHNNNKYSEWSQLKADLNHQKNSLLFKEREVWWCSVGVNVGEEENGKGQLFRRPVIIFRKLTHSSFIGIPLTSKKKIGSWYVPVKIRDKFSYGMLNQVRIWDSKRLSNRIYQLDRVFFKQLKIKFANFYCEN